MNYRKVEANEANDQSHGDLLGRQVITDGNLRTKTLKPSKYESILIRKIFALDHQESC